MNELTTILADIGMVIAALAVIYFTIDAIVSDRAADGDYDAKRPTKTNRSR
jgi:hypothetical protein